MCLKYKYLYGLKKEEKNQVYVTRGVWRWPCNLSCPARLYISKLFPRREPLQEQQYHVIL